MKVPQCGTFHAPVATVRPEEGAGDVRRVADGARRSLFSGVYRIISLRGRNRLTVLPYDVIWKQIELIVTLFAARFSDLRFSNRGNGCTKRPLIVCIADVVMS